LVAAVAVLGETPTEVTPELGGAVTATVAVPLSVVLATLVAVTVSVPAAPGAVYTPLDVMVPSFACQVTALFVVPDTVAANVTVAFAATEVVAGATFTAVVGLGAGGALVVTTICADADSAGSAMLVAVTVSVPAALGAVYTPAAVILPSFACQVTFLSDVVPATVAANVSLALTLVDADAGVTATAVTGAAELATLLEPAPAHPLVTRAPVKIIPTNSTATLRRLSRKKIILILLCLISRFSFFRGSFR
jgi:hypothetical protein